MKRLILESKFPSEKEYINKMLFLAEKSRKEGLLSLFDDFKEPPVEDFLELFEFLLLEMICEGTNPRTVEIFGLEYIKSTMTKLEKEINAVFLILNLSVNDYKIFDEIFKLKIIFKEDEEILERVKEIHSSYKNNPDDYESNIIYPILKFSEKPFNKDLYYFKVLKFFVSDYKTKIKRIMNVILKSLLLIQRGENKIQVGRILSAITGDFTILKKSGYKTYSDFVKEAKDLGIIKEEFSEEEDEIVRLSKDELARRIFLHLNNEEINDLNDNDA
jgi:hypothetical protein